MVAITAPCAFVTAPAAILIGAVAGVLVINSALFIENVLKIDDPVGASSVHGVCGAWGIIVAGPVRRRPLRRRLERRPGQVRGLLYGDGKQFVAECIGIVACVLWVGTITFVALRITDALVGNRVSRREELAGLDVPEMGIEGYTTEPIARRRSTVSALLKGSDSNEDEDKTAPGVQPGGAVGFRAKLAGVEPVGSRADGVHGALAPGRAGHRRGRHRLPLLRPRTGRSRDHDRQRRRAGGAGDPGLDQRIVPAQRSALARDAPRSPRRTRR